MELGFKPYHQPQMLVFVASSGISLCLADWAPGFTIGQKDWMLDLHLAGIAEPLIDCFAVGAMKRNAGISPINRIPTVQALIVSELLSESPSQELWLAVLRDIHAQDGVVGRDHPHSVYLEDLIRELSRERIPMDFNDIIFTGFDGWAVLVLRGSLKIILGKNTAIGFLKNPKIHNGRLGLFAVQLKRSILPSYPESHR